jgi:hypothetical protein
MTTQSTLGPFMTLILTVTARGKHAANVISFSQAEVVNSLLFAQLLTEILRKKPVRHANPQRSRVPDPQLTGMSSQFVRFA